MKRISFLIEYLSVLIGKDQSTPRGGRLRRNICSRETLKPIRKFSSISDLGTELKKQWTEDNLLKHLDKFYKRQGCSFRLTAKKLASPSSLYQALLQSEASLTTFMPELINAIETTYSVDLSVNFSTFFETIFAQSLLLVPKSITSLKQHDNIVTKDIEYYFKVVNNPKRLEEFYMVYCVSLNLEDEDTSIMPIVIKVLPLHNLRRGVGVAMIMSWG